MDCRESSTKRSLLWPLFFLIVLVTLGKYNLYIGFALKPYMLFLIVYFLVKFSGFYLQRLHLFEAGMLLFYLMYSFSGAFSLYPASSIRIIIGIALYLLCYFLSKAIIGNAEQGMVERVISTVGILFNVLSLLLYVIGLKSLNFVMAGDRLTAFGVLMDRDYPRLIGLVEDPNYFVFYNSLFFTYYLCHTSSHKNRFGLALCVLTSVLTFSRGGLLVLLLIFGLYILLLNQPLKQLKLALGSLFTLLLGAYVLVTFLKFDLVGILESRMNDFSSDGGSGRFELWGRALNFFSTHMWTGIGANNFLDYNQYQYGDTLHVHNTFLEILAESGLIGISCFLLFVFLVLYQMYQFDVLRQKPYLFLTFVAYILQMASLSVIINDMFFLYLAILSVYLNQQGALAPHPIKVQGGVNV
ncbi:O-antigen ligase family protein [Fictibacillus sp. KU28468]|uniref:O-antigen ligase family protein n=1 Tax=Fictibacillus sp. KU28468 TaxID=2991053 RepID=UPI00223E354A|nr:O-antigen ligase family protein [Fictibacillus sp. KU28468]UZJ79381.1 O-antigen ligase family protein [Fictibacillus sp. KU28468]